jgi:hypothetical protein
MTVHVVAQMHPHLLRDARKGMPGACWSILRRVGGESGFGHREWSMADVAYLVGEGCVFTPCDVAFMLDWCGRQGQKATVYIFQVGHAVSRNMLKYLISELRFSHHRRVREALYAHGILPDPKDVAKVLRLRELSGEPWAFQDVLDVAHPGLLIGRAWKALAARRRMVRQVNATSLVCERLCGRCLDAGCKVNILKALSVERS